MATLHTIMFILMLAAGGASAFQLGCARRRSETTHLSAVQTRRDWVEGGVACAVAATLVPSLAFGAERAMADDGAALVVPTIEMKQFVDPEGLFALRVPRIFFTLRRTVKGDLPDAKTGKGRRGSSIFTAGDMSKAEVVAVER